MNKIHWKCGQYIDSRRPFSAARPAYVESEHRVQARHKICSGTGPPVRWFKRTLWVDANIPPARVFAGKKIDTAFYRTLNGKERLHEGSDSPAFDSSSNIPGWAKNTSCPVDICRSLGEPDSYVKLHGLCWGSSRTGMDICPNTVNIVSGTWRHFWVVENDHRHGSESNGHRESGLLRAPVFIVMRPRIHGILQAGLNPITVFQCVLACLAQVYGTVPRRLSLTLIRKKDGASISKIT